MERNRTSRLSESGFSGALACALLAVACGGGFETQTELTAAPRRPDGVALEPVPALPRTRDHAEARGVVALREPVANRDVEELVQAYVRAFAREDEPALLQLLTPDAVPLARPSGTRQQLVESWRTKMRSFEYQRLAGMEIARVDEMERHTFETFGAPGDPPRPPAMKQGDLYIRVPIATPRLGSDQLFGDVLVLVLRRVEGRLRIAGQADENGS